MALEAQEKFQLVAMRGIVASFPEAEQQEFKAIKTQIEEKVTALCVDDKTTGMTLVALAVIALEVQDRT